MGKLKGSANTIFSSLESTARRGTDEVHQSFILPRRLHGVAVEIAFREGGKFKDMMTIVVGKMVERLDGINASNRDTVPVTFDPEEDFVHTSAYLSRDQVSNLRKVVHYSSIEKKEIIAYGLADHLLQEYSEKYPDLVIPIKQYISIKEV